MDWSFVLTQTLTQAIGIQAIIYCLAAIGLNLLTGYCGQVSLGTGLQGKTLGVVGLGRLGTAVALIGKAFGMHVIAWSENLGGGSFAEPVIGAGLTAGGGRARFDGQVGEASPATCNPTRCSRSPTIPKENRTGRPTHFLAWGLMVAKRP